jgi:hypothetical protein
VSTGGQHSFPGTGIDLFLKNGATYPDGEVVAFQLNSPPDRQPDSLSLVPRSGYFILNNYGSNKTFTVPDSIRFNGGNIDAAHGTADFNLYSRPSGAWGNTWAWPISRSTGFNYLPGNSTITFGTGNNITGFGQFALSALAVKADTVAGKCLQMDGSTTSIDVGKVNINSNNFSISCWIKPDRLQNALTQLLGHGMYGDSSYYAGFGLGFTWQGGASNLELGYTDNLVKWGNISGLIADTTAWNFVVLTYSPTGVKIYLNGVPATVKNGPMPVIDLSQSPFYVNRDIHGQRAGYKGAIDEIKFYNYALSQNEVREKMHLIQSNAPAETGLLKYFQFNQYNSATGIVPDIMSDFKAYIPNGSFLTASTAPVASGSVFRKPDVNFAGLHEFPGTGIMLVLGNGTLPDGEVVAFQLNSAPDQNPGTFPLVPASKYFIINNYGKNKTFTAPDWMVFSGLNIGSAYNPTDFRLFKRASGALGATWGNELCRSNGFYFSPGNSTVGFTAGSNVTSFGQFALSAPAPARLSVTMPGENSPNDNALATAEFYPNPNKGWGYLNITSPHDNAHVGLYLHDINGNTVYQASEQLSSNKSLFMLNFNALSSGTYILQIRFNTGELITKKVTIVK